MVDHLSRHYTCLINSLASCHVSVSSLQAIRFHISISLSPSNSIVFHLFHHDSPITNPFICHLTIAPLLVGVLGLETEHAVVS